MRRYVTVHHAGAAQGSPGRDTLPHMTPDALGRLALLHVYSLPDYMSRATILQTVRLVKLQSDISDVQGAYPSPEQVAEVSPMVAAAQGEQSRPRVGPMPAARSVSRSALR